MSTTLAATVREAREAAGLSPAELARTASISHEQLANLESDRWVPSTAVLARLAQPLGLDVTDLLTGSGIEKAAPALFFRQAPLPDFRDADRPRLLDAFRAAEALDRLNATLSRASRLRATFRPVPIGQIPYEDGEGFAVSVRDSLGNAAHRIGDIQDLLEEQFEVLVLHQRLETAKIQAVTIKSRTASFAAIVLNMAHQGYRDTLRRRATLAHELCHVLFDELQGEIDVIQDTLIDSSSLVYDSREQRANAFHAYLLVPRAGLGRLFPETKAQVSELARATEMVNRVREEFCVSGDLAVNRLVDDELVDRHLRGELLEAPRPWLSAPEATQGSDHPRALTRRIRDALDRGLVTEMRAREILGLCVWEDLPGRD